MGADTIEFGGDAGRDRSSGTSGLDETTASLHELRLKSERLGLLLEMSNTLAAFYDTQALLQRVADGAVRLLGHASAAVYLLTGETLRLETTYPQLPPAFPDHLRLAPLSEHPHIQQVITSLTPVVLPDAQNAGLTSAERSACELRGLRSLLYLPLAYGGWRIGVLIVGSVDGLHEFSDEEIAVFTALANQASLKLEEARLFHDQQRDVAELKQVIQERGRTEEALRESEVKYRLLAETTRDIILVHDMHGRITYVNQAGLEYTGFGENEVSGTSITSFVAPERRDEVVARVRRRAAGDISTYRYETEFINKEHRRITVEVNSTPMMRQGAVEQILVVARDVTENRRIEEQLRQAQKMEAIGRLAGGVAHDFNNMLSVILGYGEAILEAIPAGGPLHDDVVQVVEAAERSAELTRQLLAFSRRQTLEPEVLDLNAIILGTERLLRRVLGEDMILEFALADEIATVLADPGQMEQVILNLAINARDAMPQGGRLTIATHHAEFDADAARGRPGLEPGAHVVLTMRDTGTGMSRDDLLHIFEPFFTTKGHGTGLGLATVYGIVTQSGGAVWAESEPGTGTTFTICLPVVADTPATATGPVRTARPDAGTGEHILVVEDETALQRLLEVMITTLGYRATVATGGAEALQLLQADQFQPDLLLTDVVMPAMNGLELARRVRECRPDLKVLFMSGYATDTIARHGLFDPQAPLLRKPITLASLGTGIRAALSRSEGWAGHTS